MTTKLSPRQRRDKKKRNWVKIKNIVNNNLPKRAKALIGPVSVKKANRLMSASFAKMRAKDKEKQAKRKLSTK